MKNVIIFYFFLFYIGYIFKAFGQVAISIDTIEIGIISPQINGINCNYAADTDSLWEKYNFVQILKDINIGILRYPGGEKTSYFHWEYHGVPLRKDIYNPKSKDSHSTEYVDIEYSKKNSKQMSTDDLIIYCNEIGVEPILGINIESGIKFGKQSESLDEAIRWAKYIKEKGYRVKYWYLDNELNHKSKSNYQYVSLLDYANYIKTYSEALRKIDPGFKFIVNPMGDPDDPALDTLFLIAGKYFDVLDIHYYYNWDKVTFDQWLNTNPMDEYDKKIRTFYEKMKKLGLQIEYACLEWNIPPQSMKLEANHSNIALMQTNAYWQLIKGGTKMACIWPFLWHKQPKYSLVNQDMNYEITPFYRLMLEMKDIYGQTLLKTSTDVNNIPNIAVLNKNKKTIELFFLNKSLLTQEVLIKTNGFNPIANSKITTYYLSDNQLVNKNYDTNLSNSIKVDPLSFVKILLKFK